MILLARSLASRPAGDRLSNWPPTGKGTRSRGGIVTYACASGNSCASRWNSLAPQQVRNSARLGHSSRRAPAFASQRSSQAAPLVSQLLRARIRPDQTRRLRPKQVARAKPNDDCPPWAELLALLLGYKSPGSLRNFPPLGQQLVDSRRRRRSREELRIDPLDC